MARRRDAGSADASRPPSALGGNSCTDEGRYERNLRARAKASTSDSTSSSTTPLRAWIWAPPSSFFPSTCPVRATTGGPATKSWAHNEGVVTGRHPRRAQPCHRPQCQADDGYGGQVARDIWPRLELGQQRVSLDLNVLDGATPTCSIHQAHQRQTQIVRHLLCHDHLVANGSVIGAAAHRKVVAHHHSSPATDACAPHQ